MRPPMDDAGPRSERSERPERPDSDGFGRRGGGGGGGRRRVCRFCADSELTIDYKDSAQLKYFVSDRGKIIPRRISGNCALHQRRITTAIKRARNVAIMPYTSGG